MGRARAHVSDSGPKIRDKDRPCLACLEGATVWAERALRGWNQERRSKWEGWGSCGSGGIPAKERHWVFSTSETDSSQDSRAGPPSSWNRLLTDKGHER